MRKILLFLTLLCFTSVLVAKPIKSNWYAVYYGNTYKSARHTANGDRFDMNAMTCASIVHPFGTKLKVTNLKNGKSIIVTVTDRGQFKKNMLDLTYGAFGKLANHREGKIPISVEVVKE